MDIFSGTILVFLLFYWAISQLISSYNTNYSPNYPFPNPTNVNTYEDLLKTDEWQEKRLHILQRDNFKCCWCNKKSSLQVHHKYYNQYPNGVKVGPWDYPDDALMTLCDKCHEKAHEKYKIKVYYRKYKQYY